MSQHEVPRAPNQSPWLGQLEPDPSPAPLREDESTGVAIVGAGIAGVATAFFTLRETPMSVMLIERGRAGHGATGHNAGQLTTYFERPLCELVDDYGFDAAIAAQGAFDDSIDLLELMMAESGATAPIERLVGHMGMFSLNHVQVHLLNSLLRRRGGLRAESCVISEDAEFLVDIPSEFAGLYTVKPQATVQEMLCTTDARYRAVLSTPRGCANSALVVQQVLRFLVMTYPDRFRYVDHTPVARVVLDAAAARLAAGGHHVEAEKVVLCTNGYVEHVVENRAGDEILPAIQQGIGGTVGSMAGFVSDRRPSTVVSYLRNDIIGGSTPYVYMTRRMFERAEGPASPSSLTCFGGPERAIGDSEIYDPAGEFPGRFLDEIDSDIRPIADSSRERSLAYDYTWHGLMAYTRTKTRLIGFEPRNRVLMYNLGCNGVGFLPSVYGGQRIAQLLAGHEFAPSIFDPV